MEARTEAFVRDLMQRLPLATAALETFQFAFEEAFLQEQVYDPHRDRCYTDVLTFPHLLKMMRDCLLQHGGSGHRYCSEAQRADALPVDESSFYRKLAHMPVPVSRALLRECTGHLTQLLPPASQLLPGCFEDLEVVAVDGKKVKHAAKRLKPTRGYRGSLLGAKALVALSLRSGLALAMSDSLDGETNDVPLVPDLLPQVRQQIPRAILWLADRQFGDLHLPRQFTARPGDHFVLRLRKGVHFQADPQQPPRELSDAQGRRVLDEIGTLGTGKNALRVRRITLVGAAGQEDVVLITDLLDRQPYGALELLKLYRRRWGIERVFQQVTETFGLQHLIGCSPKAILFQLAFCLLLYNLVQVIQAYVAEDGQVERSAVSTANLFYDLKRELQAWSYLQAPAPPPAAAAGAAAMQQRLRQLLKGRWDPIAYPKAVNKNPRRYSPKPLKALPGGHSSVQRLLSGMPASPSKKK